MDVIRRTLLESETVRIDRIEARPVSDACGDVERQDSNVMVLPFAGLFAKHEAPGRHVVGTPSHAVFIAADTPYRLSFPGSIGDRAIVLRFDDTLVPEEINRGPSETPGSHGMLSADAMMRRDLLRRRLADPVGNSLEIEALAQDIIVDRDTGQLAEDVAEMKRRQICNPCQARNAPALRGRDRNRLLHAFDRARPALVCRRL